MKIKFDLTKKLNIMFIILLYTEIIITQHLLTTYTYDELNNNTLGILMLFNLVFSCIIIFMTFIYTASFEKNTKRIAGFIVISKYVLFIISNILLVNHITDHIAVIAIAIAFVTLTVLDIIFLIKISNRSKQPEVYTYKYIPTEEKQFLKEPLVDSIDGNDKTMLLKKSTWIFVLSMIILGLAGDDGLDRLQSITLLLISIVITVPFLTKIFRLAAISIYKIILFFIGFIIIYLLGSYGINFFAPIGIIFMVPLLSTLDKIEKEITFYMDELKESTE